MIKDVNNSASSNNPEHKKDTWYRNRNFPLLPIITTKKGDEHNTSSFSFFWLFFTVWTLDIVYFEIGMVASSHWGFGVIGILPYLRWAITIPLPTIMSDAIDKYTRRKP